MKHFAFFQAALAMAVGMLAQTVATRLALPSIVVLFAAGIAIGPDGLGWFDPRAFAGAQSDLVTLAVTVILFEGSLGLRLDELRRLQRSLGLLLTLGGLVSFAIGTLAARYFLGLPWGISSLYGALMIVTGPTVVTPLLSRLPLPRSLRELLIGEAVLIDPLGAIAAIVVLDYVLGNAPAWEAFWLLGTRLGVGAAVGAAAGFVLAVLLRRGWIPDSLRNPAVLAVVLLAAGGASRVSSEAGLMAAVAQGVVMANARLPDVGRLRQFKEELTVLLLSFIFVVLAAALPLRAVRDLGWNVVWVVATLAWIGRPLAVFLCTRGSRLTWQERAFASWICPRGIVAASVAALFGILLTEAGIPGGEALEALVFVTVGLTVTVQGLSAGAVARVLGVDQPELRDTLIVGADAFGRLVARALEAQQRQVVLIDRNPRLCADARREGLRALDGDALSIDDLEEAGARHADTVVALTRNPELNLLVAHRVRDNFPAERVLAVGEVAGASQVRAPFPGQRPPVDEINRQLHSARTQLVAYNEPDSAIAGKSLDALPYAPGEFAVILQRRGRATVAIAADVLLPDDVLFCLRPLATGSPLESSFAHAATLD
ncbi:cation:proton antiporter [Candidatus Binatia bacterium]|nr:cation:proton antiporter [Candidatus Binatia bacterium]